VKNEICRRRIAYPAARTSAETSGKEGFVQDMAPKHIAALAVGEPGSGSAMGFDRIDG
jgi:hypothetical protein